MVFKQEENTVGIDPRAICPFLTVFSKRLVQQTQKNQDLFGKGKG